MWKEYQDSIAQGCLTNSKHPACFVEGIYPKVIKSSHGCKLIDLEGNTYIDYICGLGTNLFGYGNDKIRTAVSNVMREGQCPSLPTLHEMELGEALKPMFKFVDKWKFLKTGNEATLAAVRMARAFTGRKKIICQGYHGHGDLFTSLTLPANGVFDSFEIFNINDPWPNLGDCAAVIIEPDFDTNYLQPLRHQCAEDGVLLIFDEIITGFRYDQHSVAKHTGVTPDLIVLGKALANGWPLAAVGGKKEVMDGDYFVSSTYAGDVYSITAAKTCIELLKSDSRYQISKLWAAGTNFLSRFNSLHQDVQIKGYPTRGRFEGDELSIALFFQEMCRLGVIFGKSWFYNFDLMDLDDFVLDCSKSVLLKIKQGEVTLDGKLPASPFADKARKS